MSRLDFNDIEITGREILTSVSIIALMLLIGALLSAKISEYQVDKNEMYNKAVKINNNKELFQYGMDTNVGNAFVYGDLKTIDPVTFPEIGGEYMSVKKIKERYTKHTRTVTKTKMVDGKSQSYTTTETYWTWDEIDKWRQASTKVTFLDVEFDYGDIYIPSENHITTVKESSRIRYVYYGSATSYIGTLFTTLKDKTVNDTKFYNGKTIEETVAIVEFNGGVILFWIVWIFLTGGLVFGFYNMENEWLKS